MEKVKVAVIGAGPTGLSMLKTLREDDFNVTLFERRSNVGGLWAFSENPTYTSALKTTIANVSKYPCGFSDFPMPEKYPTHMDSGDFQEYMEDYAKHFDLLKHIVFNTTVKQVRRSEDELFWIVEYERDGLTHESDFDKVVLCHGYQTEARIPRFEGQDEFAGPITHAQAYKDPAPFRDQTVVVVGLRASAGDIVPELASVARKVYVSHRRGAAPIKRYRNGFPQDMVVSWRRRQMAFVLQRYFPTLARVMADAALRFLTWRMYPNLDPAWGLMPAPSVLLNLPGSFEFVMPLLQDGTLTSLPGIKRFLGPRRIEFADGRIVEDVDAVLLCTGYSADFSVAAPFIQKSRPKDTPWYKGPDIYRLWMNLFPPEYADSMALLCYSAYGKSNGFSFADVTSMAISNVFRGVEPLPSSEEMERHIDEHQKWIAGRWRIEPLADTSAVKQWEFQGWLHRAAGTGMEHLGWGAKGWAFWWRDRKMSKLLNDGVETAHSYRYFETGKRKTWDGAKEAIISMNAQAKRTFPIKEDPVWPRGLRS